MLDKLKSIADGWVKYAFENPETETMARQRADVCAICPDAVYSEFTHLIDSKPEIQQGMVCRQCACPLSRKTRSKNENCPLGKWQK